MVCFFLSITYSDTLPPTRKRPISRPSSSTEVQYCTVLYRCSMVTAVVSSSQAGLPNTEAEAEAEPVYCNGCNIPRIPPTTRTLSQRIGFRQNEPRAERDSGRASQQKGTSCHRDLPPANVPQRYNQPKIRWIRNTPENSFTLKISVIQYFRVGVCPWTSLHPATVAIQCAVKGVDHLRLENLRAKRV